eukprot:CAMPEP_0180283528 /NCGR_PEP_ID=MMETSP0988-20121125/10547_1 /TAXON_ID=697907 /ORGANISM="non described non described, Strain CCMP2293" /LENGTH=593 /DNA_ID=CAMNT_0022256113 /DNA_START=13 /DNA_END=1791 /DNA_ORIENTATION=+
MEDLAIAEGAAAAPPLKILNINVGIMGHVDSGKTSLARALSTTLSTAALDKNPQSQVRGITLDLGFSSFVVPLPAHIKAEAPEYDAMQFTLVDCPGHASLIRTIIGGAQIIDLMMLVIDVTKGVQTQTAECLVVGEILMEDMLLVLNKTDLIPDEQRDEKIEKMKKGLEKVFAGTKFKQPQMVPVSATGGSTDELRANPQAVNLQGLIDALCAKVKLPKRSPNGPFYFAVDHCFPIKGKGTVLTGTVLNGSVRVNDEVELPQLKVTKKVKSMQMFKKSVQRCTQGDRVGILVTQLDAKAIERGILAAPGTVPTFSAAIVAVERVRFFKGACPTKRKFHITVGHTTVMATVHFFALPPGVPLAPNTKDTTFNYSREYLTSEELQNTSKDVPEGTQWALLVLEKPVTAPRDSLLIGSVLDQDISVNSCRLVFYGRMLDIVDPEKPEELAKIKVFKPKQKVGTVKRVVDTEVVIGKDLFKKETDITKFLNLKVSLEGTEVKGYIEGSFGASGQYKVRFSQPHGLPITPSKKGKKGKEEDDDAGEGGAAGKIVLSFKKYLFQHDKPGGGRYCSRQVRSLGWRVSPDLSLQGYLAHKK